MAFMETATSKNWANMLIPLKYIFHHNTIWETFRFTSQTNILFWIFIVLAMIYMVLSKICMTLLKHSSIKYYARQQFIRCCWQMAFFGASTLFFHFYHKLILMPQVYRIKGRHSLFQANDNIIFHKTSQCDKFEMYSLFIMAFYLHGILLDTMELDVFEIVCKSVYILSLIQIKNNAYEHFFVQFNIQLGIYHLVTETLSLLCLINNKNINFINKIYVALRLASWSYIFISVLPFNYLLPSFFSKSMKIMLNICIWLWYGLCIWNSPLLQFFYHQNYHNPIANDCSGTAKCILLRDSKEQRHFKTLRKCYLEVKLSHEKILNGQINTYNENSSAKTFQALKCIMTLKRKLKRIRENRNDETE